MNRIAWILNFCIIFYLFIYLFIIYLLFQLPVGKGKSVCFFLIKTCRITGIDFYKDLGEIILFWV